MIVTIPPISVDETFSSDFVSSGFYHEALRKKYSTILLSNHHFFLLVPSVIFLLHKGNVTTEKWLNFS